MAAVATSNIPATLPPSDDWTSTVAPAITRGGNGMQETTSTLASADGEQVFVYRWSADDGATAPRAIVQIAHGMGEHAARYRRLGEALADAGYVVYANDHRGHGRTAGSPERHGAFGKGGWSALV